jgi:hypothetical protein
MTKGMVPLSPSVADSLKIGFLRKMKRTVPESGSLDEKQWLFPMKPYAMPYKSKDMNLAIKMVEDTVLEAFQNAQL